MHKRIPLKELNLSNRFLFDEVMEDDQIHRDVLEIIFGKDLSLLSKNQTEKELRVSPKIRSIRMDVYAMDEDESIYNTEMQDERRADLAKRSRYYQSMIDTSLLEPGIPNYNLLNQTYIIMIMTFDLFGYGKYMYTFRPTCMEMPGYELQDGTTRIFLNTKGTNADEVAEELVEFLNYIENSTDEAAASTTSERIKRIHNRVCKVRTNEEVGVKYMQAWEEKYYAREEARQEGRQEGLQEGRQEGKATMKKELILSMYQEGMTIEKIAHIAKEKTETVQRWLDEIAATAK